MAQPSKPIEVGQLNSLNPDRFSPRMMILIFVIRAGPARLIALRGVRNGHVHFVPLHKASVHKHEGPPSALHHHFEPSV